jgi:hypothetical protein
MTRMVGDDLILHLKSAGAVDKLSGAGGGFLTATD